jgi:hypothetical protein
MRIGVGTTPTILVIVVTSGERCWLAAELCRLVASAARFEAACGAPAAVMGAANAAAPKALAVPVARLACPLPCRPARDVRTATVGCAALATSNADGPTGVASDVGATAGDGADWVGAVALVPAAPEEPAPVDAAPGAPLAEAPVPVELSPEEAPSPEVAVGVFAPEPAEPLPRELEP